MSFERVNPPSLAAPSGFAHAVVVTGGRLVFLAGQTALDDSGSIVGASVTEQFEQALRNLLTALAAAGGTPEHLASLTIYAVDLADSRARPRHRRGLAAAGGPRVPGHGRDRRLPAVGHRGPGRDPGLRGHPAGVS